MSDMEQSDVVVPEVPAPAAAPVEPTAPEQPAAVEAPAPAPQPDPVPVLAQQPSSASETQQPETAPERETLSLEDSARVVVILVKAHRTVGDADLGAALADLEAALPAQD